MFGQCDSFAHLRFSFYNVCSLSFGWVCDFFCSSAALLSFNFFSTDSFSGVLPPGAESCCLFSTMSIYLRIFFSAEMSGCKVSSWVRRKFGIQCRKIHRCAAVQLHQGADSFVKRVQFLLVLGGISVLGQLEVFLDKGIMNGLQLGMDGSSVLDLGDCPHTVFILLQLPAERGGGLVQVRNCSVQILDGIQRMGFQIVHSPFDFLKVPDSAFQLCLARPIAALLVAEIEVVHQQVGQRGFICLCLFQSIQKKLLLFVQVCDSALQPTNCAADGLHQAVGSSNVPVQVAEKSFHAALFHLVRSRAEMHGRYLLDALPLKGAQVNTFRSASSFQIAVGDGLPAMPPDLGVLLVVLAEQPFAALISGPGNSGLPLAALDDGDFEMRTRNRHHLLMTFESFSCKNHGIMVLLFWISKQKAGEPMPERKSQQELDFERKHEEDLQRLRGLRLIDDDFMAAVFEERACAEFLLQIILKRDDLTVKEVHGQYSIKNLQGRSVRLDILAVDRENRAYNIEVQRSDRGASEKRARYNSSLLDANLTDAGDDYDALNETYVIFITENDVLKAGLPIYHVDRTVRETGTFFNDQAHIVYVNSQIKDETALGKLMHDFFCTNSKDMNYSILAQRVRYFKEDTKGVAAMCRAMEKMRDETEHETSVKHALAMLADGVPCEKVAKYTDLSIEEVRALAEKKSA